MSELHSNALKKLNIKVFEGLGRFLNQNTIEVICPKRKNILNIVTAKKILISVGGKPKELNIPGKDLAWSSDDIFELKHFPKTLLIVGGGYIACEFASIFKNLGTEVTQLIRGKSLLNGFDKDYQNV